MSVRLWLWRRAHDTSAEAQRHLRLLDERHDEVAQLGAQVREQLGRNHFSEMVTRAISRRVDEDR